MRIIPPRSRPSPVTHPQPAQTPAPRTTPLTHGVSRPGPASNLADRFEAAAPRSVSTSIDGPITDPANGGRPDFAQGDTNACGTTSLAIVLHRLGIEVPVAEIDRAIRNYDLYTPVNGILGYARGRGLQAEVYNHGSFEQLRRDLSAGRQIMVLTDVGGYDARRDLQPGSRKDFGFHWMVVTEAFERNGQPYVTYMNPWGTKETLPYEKFEALWRDVHALGLPTGYDRTYVLIDRDTASPLRPSNAGDLTSINRVTGGISNVANGWADVTRGDVRGGLVRMGRGVGQTIVGGAGTAVRTTGEVISRGAEKVGDAVGGLFDRIFGR